MPSIPTARCRIPRPRLRARTPNWPAAKGDRATAAAELKAFEPDANRLHWAAMRQALVYAKLGDRDAAMHWVNRSAELGNHSWFAWVKHPWTQPLQTDPEFQTILGK